MGLDLTFSNMNVMYIFTQMYIYMKINEVLHWKQLTGGQTLHLAHHFYSISSKVMRNAASNTPNGSTL